jgi:hypothetical protein
MWSNYGTRESKKKYRQQANDVQYDLAPALDEDIATSNTNMKTAEGKLGEWTIDTEPKYNPYYWEAK